VTASPSPATAAWQGRALRLAQRFVQGLRAHNAFEAAASIAFWFFLSVVPLLVLVGFLVGQVARTRGVDALLSPLLDVVPGSAESLVRSELERLAGGSTSSIAPLGVIGFLWTASSGLHNLMDVFEIAVQAARRSWWKQRVMALGWVAIGLAAACVLAWVLMTLDSTLHEHDAGPGPASVASTMPQAPSQAPSSRAFDHGAGHGQAAPSRIRGALKGRVHKALQTPHEQILAVALLLAAGMALLAGFYRFAVEHPPGVKRRVWPGAASAVGSWLLVSWAFEAYALSIADYALYYGSLAAVAVLLVWLYLTSLSLVLGAEINAQLEGVREVE
jgi:membrane protein